jgi:hypothetical protein
MISLSTFIGRLNICSVIVESGSWFIYVISVCLRIVVSNTYCVVFYLVFCCLVHPMLPVFLDCPFLIAPSVFSNVYFTSYISLNNHHHIIYRILVQSVSLISYKFGNSLLSELIWILLECKLRQTDINFRVAKI